MECVFYRRDRDELEDEGSGDRFPERRDDDRGGGLCRLDPLRDDDVRGGESA